jgi:hypothetical protein
MLTILRDLLLSFCPAVVRRNIRPASPARTLRFATWGGLLQFLLAGFALVLGFKSYFTLRAHQLGPHVSGMTEVIEAGVVVFIALEYLVHPLSFVLLYLAGEGLVRFAGGLITAEVLPCFFVFLAFKAAQLATRRRERRRIGTLPPDTLEHLPDNRVRIASAQPKAGWNASVTIGVSGEWFEVERTEAGWPPRSWIYILRPSSPAKILRGYQEYDVASAVSPEAGSENPDSGRARST